MCSERGLCVGLCFGWFGRVRAGLAPRATLLLVGGRRCARGGIVCAEDAGLCVVQERGLSPRTPVVTSQGLPARFEGHGRGLSFGRGGVSRR